MLSCGEIKEYRYVGKIGGRQYTIFRTSSRRLSKGEENAVALIGLRMVSENRRWIPGETHEVSVGSVMTRVFDNPKLMARTVFETWFKRVGIKRVRHTTSTRGSWLMVPNDLDGRTMAFGDPGPGTCWEILVKRDVLYEAMKLHAANKWQRNPMNGNIQKSEEITTPIAADVNREVDVSGRSQTNAASPGNLEPLPMDLTNPKDMFVLSDPWQDEVNRVYNERCDNAQMAIQPPWLKPSDPATIVEDLNKIDKLLDEAEQMSQVGYQDEVYSVWDEPQVAAPQAQVAVPEAQNVRRIVVPPEARLLDEEDN